MTWGYKKGSFKYDLFVSIARKHKNIETYMNEIVVKISRCKIGYPSVFK